MKDHGGTLILVLDDDEAGASLQCLLRENGYRVIRGAGGPEGLSMARTLNPNLVLMDLMTPGKDGVSSFQEIRKNPRTRHIKVIAFSSMPHTTDRLLWADAFFETPFSYKELLETVEYLL